MSRTSLTTADKNQSPKKRTVLGVIWSVLWKGIKYCYRHPKFGVPVLSLLILIVPFFWFCYPPRLVFLGGVDMGKLYYDSGGTLNRITVSGHLYPRRYFLTGLSNATKHKPEFERRADAMVAKWLEEHPNFELIPGGSGATQGDRESSWGRSTDRQNRRLQVTISYFVRLKSPASLPPPEQQPKSDVTGQLNKPGG